MRDDLSSRSGATRVVIHGALGRMGARLCALAAAGDGVRLVGAVDRESSASSIAGGVRVTASIDEAPPCDVVIDFSSDEGARAAPALARQCGSALLVGTTGLSRETEGLLRSAAAERAVLVAANMALGVAVLAALARRAAAALGPAYRAAIVEAHHAGKKDAPSGTALRLAEAARSAGADLPADQVLSIRGGDVVGEHTLRFAGAGEYLELIHRATTRDVFAAGALRAARWLHGRPPGWWTIEDVLGLGPG